MSHIINFWKDVNKTNLEQQVNCCGCSACENICPSSAISMCYDDEGFMYPLLKEEQCLDCGLCLRVCPVVNDCNEYQSYQQIYAGYSVDQQIISVSASGGFASELSRLIVQKGGVVFGVQNDDEYVKSRYSMAASLEDLSRFASSKYVQSEKGRIYTEVKQKLIEGKLVLFTGLPCDIAALKLFLRTEYDNLVTCELICMGVSSYKIAEDYKAWREKKKSARLVFVNARSKHCGWFVPHLEEHFSDGKKYYSTLYGTYYGHAMLTYNRPSCYECHYRGDVGVADFRIGDFWGVSKKDPFYNESGVSCIFVRTHKGRTLIKELGHSGFYLYEVEYNDAADNNMSFNVNKPSKYVELRHRFLLEYQRKGLVSACWNTANLGFLIKYLIPLKYAMQLKHLYHSIIDKQK